MLLKPNKQGLIDTLKKSITFFEKPQRRQTISTLEDNLENQDKIFNQTLKQKNRLIYAKIIGYKLVQEADKVSYTTYEISVLTQDAHYYILKRYSQFYKLYEQMRLVSAQTINFPGKTYFRCGTDKNIINSRIVQLNAFLTTLNENKQNKLLIDHYYSFLELKKHYQEKQININKIIPHNEISNQISSTDFIKIQLIKINNNSSNIIDIIQNIQVLLLQSKSKIQLDSVRQILFGFQTMQGLPKYCFNNTNELITIQGLKTLTNLFNQQKTPYAEKYKHLFHSLSIDCITLCNFSILNNSIAKQLYFILLSYYFERRIQISYQLGIVFKKDENIINNYYQWVNGNKLEQKKDHQKDNQSQYTIQNQQFIKTFSSNESKSINSPYCISFEDYKPSEESSIYSNYQIVRQYTQKMAYCSVYQSIETNQIRIQAMSRKKYPEIVQKLKNWKWSSMFQITEDNKYDGVIDLNVHLHNKVKKIRCFMKEEEQENSFKQVVKPFQIILGNINFTQMVSVEQIRSQKQLFCMITILYQFNDRRTQVLFKQQICEGTLLYNGIISNLL